MGFNYAKEKKKFDEEWKKLRTEYEQAGMSQLVICEIYDYDWREFCSRRVYSDHNQQLPDTYFEIEPGHKCSSLYRRYPALSMTFDETDFEGRYAWIDSIDNPQIAGKLKKLSQQDLEILTLLAIEGYSQRELAAQMGCSQNAISKRVKKIRALLA